MATTLQTSDYVSMLGAAAQIASSIAVAVWAVRKTVPPKAAANSTSRIEGRKLLGQWLRATWVFLLFGALGLANTLQLIFGAEPLSRGFVIHLVLSTLYTTLNLLGSLTAFLYLIQNRLNELSLKHMEGTDKVLGGLLSIREKTTQSQADLLTVPATPKTKSQDPGSGGQ